MLYIQDDRVHTHYAANIIYRVITTDALASKVAKYKPGVIRKIMSLTLLADHAKKIENFGSLLARLSDFSNILYSK